MPTHLPLTATSYTFTHTAISGATTVLGPSHACVFALFEDAGVAPVTPRAGAPPAPAGGSRVFGASFYDIVASAGGAKIAAMYLTRQLSSAAPGT